MRNKEYSDRRSDAAAARAAMLERCQSSKTAAAPGLVARLAARAEIAKARDERVAAREAEKAAEKLQAAAEAARIAEEDHRQREAEISSAEAHRLARDNRIALVLSDEAARKAARDLRYAKRKSGQLVA